MRAADTKGSERRLDRLACCRCTRWGHAETVKQGAEPGAAPLLGLAALWSKCANDTRWWETFGPRDSTAISLCANSVAMADSTIRNVFSRRWTVVRAIFGARWKRAIGWSWAGLGAWDLALSQVVPADTAQKFPKLYQVVEMTSGFLSLSGWLSGVASLIALFSVEYAYRHTRKSAADPTVGNPDAMSVASAPKPRPRKSSEVPQEEAAVEQPRKADARSRVDTLSVLPRPRPAPAASTKPLPDVPDWDWGKLYSRSEEGNLIHLRFLPDTSDVAKCTVVLIVYGYKVLMNLDTVSVRIVHNEVRRVQREAPNAKRFHGALGLYEFTAMLQDLDYGQPAIDGGYLRRVRLSEGGAYELTTYGLVIARSTAFDLIERA